MPPFLFIAPPLGPSVRPVSAFNMNMAVSAKAYGVKNKHDRDLYDLECNG